ncbi:hypothetical protein [Catelliglobosispora koreensis]|uniref:hypothetical protein n=1 Tax=Catelliglobosispora koreensis TaxID=129052 RepID=UPI00037389E5|nr:hypothetical protein [Catelliglobosispora koreensis]
MLDPFGRAEVAAAFGVPETQVREVAGISVRPYFFTKAPLDWATQLAPQTGQLTSAEECLSAVRLAFAEALDWDQDTAREQ